MIKYWIFLAFSLSILLLSCDNSNGTLDDEVLGYNYTPLELGKYKVYQVDSIVYTQAGNIIDTTRGYIKEEVVDTFINASGENAFRIERRFKRLLTDMWSEPKVWSAVKNESFYSRTEENIRFVKFVFPPIIGGTWEGDRFFDENIMVNIGGEFLQPYISWDYLIEEDNLTYDELGISSNDVIKLKLAEEESIIYKRNAVEYYARNIGLVKKEMTILETQCFPDCIGESFEDFAEKGMILTQTLLEFN